MKDYCNNQAQTIKNYPILITSIYQLGQATIFFSNDTKVHPWYRWYFQCLLKSMIIFLHQFLLEVFSSCILTSRGGQALDYCFEMGIKPSSRHKKSPWGVRYVPCRDTNLHGLSLNRWHAEITVQLSWWIGDIPLSKKTEGTFKRGGSYVTGSGGAMHRIDATILGMAVQLQTLHIFHSWLCVWFFKWTEMP